MSDSKPLIAKESSSEFESDSSTAERLVQWLLRMIGVVLLSAIVPVFFSRSLISQTHEQLGLDSFPDQPISWYFARTLSLMYFAHGLFVFSLSTNVRRYWPLIQMLCALNLALGVLITGIDIVTEMPWWWTLIEGPSIVVGGIVLLALIVWQNRLLMTGRTKA